MRVGIALLLALTGCDYLFNIDHVADQPLIDAFDLMRDCRADYDMALWPGSRFRVIELMQPVWDANDQCNDDVPGATHLAVILTHDKLAALIGTLGARQQGTWWIGAVQPVSAIDVGDNWLWMTGEPVDRTMWNMGEPNDANDNEDGHVEQFTILDQDRVGLVDVNGKDPRRALCECDGHAVSEDAALAIAQSRM